jgi:hypothetical protein
MPVTRDGHFVAFLLEVELQAPGERLFVFDNKDVGHGSQKASGAA